MVSSAKYNRSSFVDGWLYFFEGTSLYHGCCVCTDVALFCAELLAPVRETQHVVVDEVLFGDDFVLVRGRVAEVLRKKEIVSESECSALAIVSSGSSVILLTEFMLVTVGLVVNVFVVVNVGYSYSYRPS